MLAPRFLNQASEHRRSDPLSLQRRNDVELGKVDGRALDLGLEPAGVRSIHRDDLDFFNLELLGKSFVFSESSGSYPT